MPFFRSFFHGLTGLGEDFHGALWNRHFRGWKPHYPRCLSSAALWAENHRMHDPSRQEGEQAGDDQRAKEDRDHRLLVAADIVPARMQHREHQHDGCEDREQMQSPRY